MIERICDICKEVMSAENTCVHIGRLFIYFGYSGIVEKERLSKYDICDKCLHKILPHWESWEKDEYVQSHKGMYVSPDIWENYFGRWAR